MTRTPSELILAAMSWKGRSRAQVREDAATAAAMIDHMAANQGATTLHELIMTQYVERKTVIRLMKIAETAGLVALVQPRPKTWELVRP